MIERAGVADRVAPSASRVEARKMRVLMVGSGKPSVAAGGIGTVLRTLMRGLDGRHEVEFLVNDWGSPRPTLASERDLSFFLFRMRALSLRDRGLRSLAGSTVWAAPTVARLARFVREHRKPHGRRRTTK